MKNNDKNDGDQDDIFDSGTGAAPVPEPKTDPENEDFQLAIVGPTHHELELMVLTNSLATATDLVAYCPPAPAHGPVIFTRVVSSGRGENKTSKEVPAFPNVPRLAEFLYRPYRRYFSPYSGDPDSGGTWTFHHPESGDQHVPIERRVMLAAATVLANMMAEVCSAPLAPDRLAREILRAAEEKPWPTRSRENKAVSWVRRYVVGPESGNRPGQSAERSSQLVIEDAITHYSRWAGLPRDSESDIRKRRKEVRSAIDSEFGHLYKSNAVRYDNHLGDAKDKRGWWGLQLQVSASLAVGAFIKGNQ